MIAFGVTDHLEWPREAPSSVIYQKVIEQTLYADALGFEYAWFAEHHAHLHAGHLPSPLLLALHLAGRTRQIRLGPAVICMNLHHPLDAAEQVAAADLLSGGRLAPGFGSGSTPTEAALFNSGAIDEPARHARFADGLKLLLAAWRGKVSEAEGRPFGVPAHEPLPVAADDLHARSWLAVNSVGAATIAGALGFNMLFSHLRTPAEYRAYRSAYHAADGRGRVAANRPVHVAENDAAAFQRAEPALRTIWRRFRDEGKIPAQTEEPRDPEDLCAHPLNFIVGGPERVAREMLRLHAEAPYDVMNVEVRWAGLSDDAIHDCMQRLIEYVRPRVATA